MEIKRRELGEAVLILLWNKPLDVSESATIKIETQKLEKNLNSLPFHGFARLLFLIKCSVVQQGTDLTNGPKAKS